MEGKLGLLGTFGRSNGVRHPIIKFEHFTRLQNIVRMSFLFNRNDMFMYTFFTFTSFFIYLKPQSMFTNFHIELINLVMQPVIINYFCIICTNECVSSIERVPYDICITLHLLMLPC